MLIFGFDFVDNWLIFVVAIRLQASKLSSYLLNFWLLIARCLSVVNINPAFPDFAQGWRTIQYEKT